MNTKWVQPTRLGLVGTAMHHQRSYVGHPCWGGGERGGRRWRGLQNTNEDCPLKGTYAFMNTKGDVRIKRGKDINHESYVAEWCRFAFHSYMYNIVIYYYVQACSDVH